MPVIVLCEECGKSVKMGPAQYKRSDHHFCSVSCRMKYLNKNLNPSRMTPEVKAKLRKARLGSGEGKTYEKTYGRHTHRVVAEQMLGRSLRKGEVVHHIDGNKRNNDPSNLMIFKSQAEHAKYHRITEGGEKNDKPVSASERRS